MARVTARPKYLLVIGLSIIVFVLYTSILRSIYHVLLALALSLLAAVFLLLFVTRKSRLQLILRTHGLIYIITSLCLLSFVLVPSVSGDLLVDFGNVNFANWIRVFSSFLFTSVLPGFFITNMIDQKNKLGLATKLAVAYSISITCSILFTYIGTLITSDFADVLLWYVVFTALLALLSLISDLLNRREKFVKVVRVEIFDWIVLCLIICFVFLAWISLNPINFQNWDSERLRSGALAIQKGVAFESSGYYWSSWLQNHFALSAGLSGIPPVNFQYFYIFIYVFYVIAFYSMAKTFFTEKRHQIVPILATLFFTIFSGYGWINALSQHFLFSQSWVDSLYLGGAATNFDIVFSALPREEFSRIAGFTGVFAYMSLVKSKDMTAPRKTLLSIFVILSMLAYVPSFIILAVFAFTLIISDLKDRRKYSASIGSIVIAVLLALLIERNSWGNFEIIRAYLVLIVISITLYTLTFISEAPIRIISRVSKTLLTNLRKRAGAILAAVAISVYALSFIFWGFIAGSVDFAKIVYGSGLVPWYTYPLLIGVIGIIALVLFARAVLSGKVIYNEEKYFVALALVLFVSAKSVAIAQEMNIALYFERRFLPFIIGAIGTVAAIELSRLKLHRARHLVALIIIFIIGVSSTALQADLNSITTNNPWEQVSSSQLQAANFLWNQGNAYESVLVVSPYNKFMHPDAASYPIEYYSGMKTQNMYGYGSTVLGNGIISVQYLLDLVKGWNTKYMFFSSEIMSNLDEIYPEDSLLGFAASHFSVAFSNSESSVLRVPELSSPVDDSRIKIIVPSNEANDFEYTYPIMGLALSGVKYSILYCTEGEFKRLPTSSVMVLSSDPAEVSISWEMNALSWIEDGGTLLILNTNGKGFFGSRFIEAVEDKRIMCSDGIGDNEPLIQLPTFNTTVEIPRPETNALLYYMSNSSEIAPFLSVLEIGKGKIGYLNLSSYLYAVSAEKEKHKSEYFLNLGLIVKLALDSLELTDVSKTEVDSTFPQATFLTYGNVEAANATFVTSDIVIPSEGLNVGEIYITSAMGGTSKTYENFTITSIMVNGTAIARADSISLKGYRDQYVIVDDSLQQIAFEISGKTTLELVGFERRNNGTLVQHFLENAQIILSHIQPQNNDSYLTQLLINLKPESAFLIRTPIIHATGLTTFINATQIEIKKPVNWGRTEIANANFSITSSNSKFMKIELWEGSTTTASEEQLDENSELFDYELGLPWNVITASPGLLIFSCLVIFICVMSVRKKASISCSKAKLNGRKNCLKR